MSIKLSDEAVILRPFDEKDVPEHLAGEDEKQIKWLSGGKSNLESVKKWIVKNQKFWEKGGPVFNLAIVEKVHNKLAGMIEANTDFEKIEGLEPGNANISYGIYSQYRGKGYATRAINLIMDFLRGKEIKRAIIRTNPQNEASVRVAQRCGFERAGEVDTKEGRLVRFVKNL